MKTIILSLIIFTGALAQAGRESGGRIAAKSVYVNFASPGNGIDLTTQKIAADLVAAGQAASQITEVKQSRYGREGETILCVTFTQNPLGLPAAFITNIAPSIRADIAKMGRQRTFVSLGETCDDYASATEQDIQKY